MKKTFFTFWIPCMFWIAAFTGCAHHNVAISGEIKSYQSGNLNLPSRSDVPRTIYVEMSDSANPGVLAKAVERAVARQNFRIADSPSNAGYILHINVVRQGDVDPARFASLVDTGYGGEARFSGRGATGMIADALLVQRIVPKEKRPSRARLKNITSRNARDSAQMRVGLITTGGGSSSANGKFSQELARIIQGSLAAQSRASAEEE